MTATNVRPAELVQAPRSRPRATLRTARDMVAVVALIVLVLLAAPGLLNAYWLTTATTGALFVLPVAGVGLLYGRLAIVSMFHVALMGIGGWTALRLSFGTDLPFVAVIFLAGATTTVLGLVVGLPTLRLSGLYFALISLMAAGAVEVVLMTKGFPNGGSGFFGIKDILETPEAMSRPALATTDAAYFRYTVVVVAVLMLVLWLHRRGRPGRSWATIRRGEACAQSLGVDVSRYKLWAIALSAFLPGVGGALLAGQIGTLDASEFTASGSVVLFAVTLMGGAFSLFGAVIGGLASQLVPALLDKLSFDGNASLLIFGFGMIMTLATAPLGIAGQLADAAQAIRRWVKQLVGRHA